MKIVLNGQAGTNSHAIAIKLADRLGLDCITATSFFPRYCFDSDERLKPEYRLHENSDIDDEINTGIKNEISKREDGFLVNSINGIFYVPDAIRILLIQDIQSKPSLAAIYKYHLADVKAAYKGAFVENNYDIVINVFGSTIDDVITCIINALQSGKYGKYVPINIMLPSRVDDIIVRNYLDDDIQLYVYKGCKFIKPRSMDAALSYARAGANLVRVTETEVIDFLVLKREDYLSWFERINMKPDAALNYLTFALYCFTYGYTDSNQVYCNLCSNGNPYKRMEAEGIRI